MEDKIAIIPFAKGLIYAGFAFLQIDKHLFNILLIFMILDTIAGLVKVLKVDKDKFSFKALMWGMCSKIGILIVPLLVALLFKGIGQEMGFGVELIIKILIVSEFISVISNVYTIKTGKQVKDIDVFSLLFKFIRCKAIKLIANWTGKEIDAGEECGTIKPDKEKGEEKIKETTEEEAKPA